MTELEVRDIAAVIGMLATSGGVLVGIGVLIQKINSLAAGQAGQGQKLEEMDRYMRNGLSTRTAEAHKNAEEARKTADLAIGIARKAEDGIGAVLGEVKSIRAVCEERHHGVAAATIRAGGDA